MPHRCPLHWSVCAFKSLPLSRTGTECEGSPSSSNLRQRCARRTRVEVEGEIRLAGGWSLVMVALRCIGSSEEGMKLGVGIGDEDELTAVSKNDLCHRCCKRLLTLHSFVQSIGRRRLVRVSKSGDSRQAWIGMSFDEWRILRAILFNGGIG